MSSEITSSVRLTPTEQQQRAIAYPLQPYLILAGAGTGKTTVMSARIAWLVSQGMSPTRILGLTFTTKAAGELAARVRRDLITAVADAGLPTEAMAANQPTIATYHSFGAQLLREHAVRIGLEPDARVVVDALRYQLAHRVIANTNVDLGALGYDPRSAVSDLLTLDQSLADYLLEPADLAAGERTRAEVYQRPDYRLSEHEVMVRTCLKRAAILDVLAEFRAAKVEYDLIDYADQIRLAAKAAAASPSMGETLRLTYDVVLLDEYQDTSVGQKLLLQRLFGNGFPVTAVGDPLQAIYRWRGADVSNISNFTEDFPALRDGQLVPSETLPLFENWRSCQEVLEVANRISADLRALHQAPALTAGRTGLQPAVIEAALFPTFADEVRWIAQRIHNLGPSLPWSEMAVLMRDKKNLSTLVNELEALGVPVQVADAGALFALPEVREVICYLQVLADPTDNPALARLLAGPRWRLGSRDLALLGEHAYRLANPRHDIGEQSFDLQLEHIVAGRDAAERVSLVDALERAGDIVGCSPEAGIRLEALAAELRQLRRHLGEPLPDLVARVVRTTGLGIEALTRTMPNGTSRYDRLAMLYDVVSGFSDLDGRSSLESFLSYVRDSDRFGVSVESELPLTREAVTVMSMHKSKGLEYQVVALPGMSNGTFPSNAKDKYWIGNVDVMPPHYLPGTPEPSLVRFPGAEQDMKQDIAAHKAQVLAEQDQDEVRLAYVAVTRAAHHVLACGSWWGPTQIKKKGPSPFLVAIKAHASEIPHWEPEPVDSRNPTLAASVPPVWPDPIDPNALAALREQAALVQHYVVDSARSVEGLTPDELALVAEWDTDIAAVQDQLRHSLQESRVVRLPDTLTASQVMVLRSDPEGFLADLVRPMPQPPSRAADRGTAFHAWVEVFYGSRGLFEPDSLPGAMDDVIYSDAALDELKRAFEAGQFAHRTPHVMEAPFALVVAGRPLRGRIDAVFRGTADDPQAPGKWLVVDWKTGTPGSADPVQLDIYRHAWAELAEVPATDVVAAFYYVTADRLEPLTQPRTLTELAGLLAAPAP